MRRQKAGSHAISGVFVFLLLGLFAIFAVVMVLLGAGTYSRTTESAEAHNEQRVAPSYIRTMIRGHDEAGGVQTERLSGILRENEDTGENWTEQVDLDAIVLTDETAVTRLFVYNGWLYECTEVSSDPYAGSEDLEADFSQDDEIILIDETAPEEGAQEAPAFTPGVCDGACMQQVCQADEMTVERTGDLLTIHLRSGETWHTLACALHTGDA